MPPQRGRMRRTCWRPSTTTLFKPSVVPWTPFTNCQKKGAVPTRPPVRRLSPHRREQSNGDGKNTYWSSPLRPNDSRGQQTKRREGSLPLPFDASPHSPKGAHLYVHSATNPSAISRNTRQWKTPGFPSPRGIRSNDSTRSRSSWNRDMTREQIRRFRRAQKKQRYPYRCFGN